MLNQFLRRLGIPLVSQPHEALVSGLEQPGGVDTQWFVACARARKRQHAEHGVRDRQASGGDRNIVCDKQKKDENNGTEYGGKLARR